MARKLNQVLAIEKGIKTRVNTEITELHKSTQKDAPFNGFDKRYTPVNESGRQLPPESLKVQLNAEDVLKTVQKSLSELFDVTATKDYANCGALADVVVGGTTLLKQVPTTYLLFLDKQLTDLNTFVSKLAELDPAVVWSKDASSGLHKSEVVQTQRTEKVQEALVLYPATEKHPAQTQLITNDVVVGYWNTTKVSGAIAKTQKVAILDRVQKLHQAVKEALEQANMTPAPDQNIGQTVFSYLFG